MITILAAATMMLTSNEVAELKTEWVDTSRNEKYTLTATAVVSSDTKTQTRLAKRNKQRITVRVNLKKRGGKGNKIGANVGERVYVYVTDESGECLKTDMIKTDPEFMGGVNIDVPLKDTYHIVCYAIVRGKKIGQSVILTK